MRFQTKAHYCIRVKTIRKCEREALATIRRQKHHVRQTDNELSGNKLMETLKYDER